MTEDEQIIELATRAQFEPESLTHEEIRQLALAVMCDLNDAGEMLKGEILNRN